MIFATRPSRIGLPLIAAALGLIPAACASAAEEVIWVEAEKPARSSMHRHPSWYDRVKRDQLSGGDFVTNFDDNRVGEAGYRFNAGTAGDHTFWVRANPIKARLSYRLNGGPWRPIDLEKDQRDSVNLAADGKPDLRFLAWVKVGRVPLRRGANSVEFRMDSPLHNHGALDCFLFARSDFVPQGMRKPGQSAAAAEAGWFAFDPPPDRFDASAGFDLRHFNEPVAGAGGVIGVKDGRFVQTGTGRPIRFWAVNGPSGKNAEEVAAEARMLAKRGVNLVRIHHGYYDKQGKLDPKAVLKAIADVEALKSEGIYTHFSIYFPLWLDPAPDHPQLQGYDGKKHPFAAIFFDEDFQELYRSWWTALLTTPSPATGKRLVDDPAVAGLEILNEDSFFFWTFNPDAVPDPELRILEKKFGEWLTRTHGSIDAAFRAWKGQKVARDRPAEGRVGFRPLWNIANERSARDRDTSRFLYETQRGFYEQTYQFLRGLGFKGLITASNWHTASPEVLGPLEKLSYTATDFIDRHGYFGGRHKGDQAAWSIRDGHTYTDRSALRFEPSEPGKPLEFRHPAMDPSYDGLPSMISETTWNRPNRYRSEAPLYYAAYGALQETDAIVHFALDGASWSVKPGYFMQPWTLMSPAMMGQFPAAALIYRFGLVAPGELVVDLPLARGDLLALKGTPMPQDASFDELRLKDVPSGTTLAPGNRIDPLVHYVGRTAVRFVDRPEPARLADLTRYIDRDARVVTSSNGQLRLDYGKGLLTIRAPMAQGASGDLKAAGAIDLPDLEVASGLDLGHIVVVGLDGQPLASSARMLLQVMSEERPTGFEVEPAGEDTRRIVSIGRDPWQVREIDGTVKFKRSDASSLKVTRLDPNGQPAGPAGAADAIRLDKETIYYLITR